MVTPYLVVLALVGAERLLELIVSRRHAAWAFRHGGIEVGRRHFPAMAVLHGGFLLACAVEVLVASRPFHPPLGAAMLGLALLAQALRWWAVTSLGPYWNVRVIVVPGAQVVTRGPYRMLRHPNYLAVVLEGVAIPMIHTAWVTAVVFTVANAVLLAIRIRCEEAALERHCGYSTRLGGRPRLLPVGGRPLERCAPTS